MDSWGHEGLWTRGDDNDATTGYESAAGDSVRGPYKATSNSTSAAIINQFRFQSAKSIRTSTIILAVFNVIAAFATAVGIIWDGYATAKRNNQKFGFRYGIWHRYRGGVNSLTAHSRTHGFTFVGPAESFPLILSVGIVVQGIVFAVAQSTGLDHLLTLGCTITSQMMLPAVFIVPYIQLVFALEVAFRSLRKNPLPPRSKWNVTICLAIVGTFLLVTYLVTLFVRPPNFCFASLFWFVQRWQEGCFVILTLIAVALLASTLVIFCRLHNNVRIENSERVAASRMVYFLAVAFISTTLLIPFFFNLSFTEQRGATGQALTLAMIASVVANVSGLMTGGLHLFLRSNTLSTIGPRQNEKWESERNKLKAGIRVYSGGNDDYENHMMNPVGRAQSLRRMDSTDSLVPEKEEEARIESPSGSPTYASPLRSNAVWQPAPLRAPEPAQVPTYQIPKAHARKRSYSLFPTEQQNNTKSITLLPAKTYAPGAMTLDEDDMMALQPPPRIHPQGIRHRRDSSLASSATVQIGLRLSNVDDMPPLNSQYFQNNASVNSLNCPNDQDADALKRPSPLAQVDVNSDSDSSDSEEDDTLVSSPPQQLTLSPAVYRPESPQRTRVTSPQGVGFNNLAQRKKAPVKCTKQDCQCSGQHDKRDWI
ncbi:hypothetical protein LZ30DRAFT_576139 [Colletotrichum cereale]|nr:hypothetical protein LZ30DRAFT_576139 [Colletotrichum cereale]